MMVSLDELNDLYELELDECGHLITKDNYYQFINEEDMDEEDASSLLQNALEKVLAESNPIYKQIYYLLLEEKTTREIASILGISQPAVVKNIKRLKEKVKKFM